MNMSRRNLNMVGLLLALLLIGAAVLFTYRKLPQIRETRDAITEQSQVIGMRERKKAKKGPLSIKLDGLVGSLPVYPLRKDVSAELYGQIESMATKTGLSLLKLEAEQEKEMTGGVYQMEIDCNFRATGEAVVQFLYLAQSKGGALDVSYLRHEPKTREPGFVEGRFRMDCAYRRVDIAAARGAVIMPAPGGAKTKPAEASAPKPLGDAAVPKPEGPFPPRTGALTPITRPGGSGVVARPPRPGPPGVPTMPRSPRPPSGVTTAPAPPLSPGTVPGAASGQPAKPGQPAKQTPTIPASILRSRPSSAVPRPNQPTRVGTGSVIPAGTTAPAGTVLPRPPSLNRGVIVNDLPASVPTRLPNTLRPTNLPNIPPPVRGTVPAVPGTPIQLPNR